MSRDFVDPLKSQQTAPSLDLKSFSPKEAKPKIFVTTDIVYRHSAWQLKGARTTNEATKQI